MLRGGPPNPGRKPRDDWQCRMPQAQTGPRGFLGAAHFLSEMAESVGLAPAQCIQMLDTIPEGQTDWISRKWWDAAAVDIPAEDMSPG